MELWSKKQRDTRSSRLQQVGEETEAGTAGGGGGGGIGGISVTVARLLKTARQKKADSPCENSACADECLVGRGGGGGHRRGLDQQRAPHMPPPICFPTNGLNHPPALLQSTNPEHARGDGAERARPCAHLHNEGGGAAKRSTLHHSSGTTACRRFATMFRYCRC